MINETKMKVFLCVANTLNFTEAAQQLFMTQQAVSKHISALEDELGFPILIRRPHSVKLTEAGERGRVFFQDILQRTNDFLESERELQRRRSKALRIGYNNWLEFGKAISDAQTIFHSNRPDISIVPERQAPDILQLKLQENELDIILILKRFIRNNNNLKCLELAELPLSIITKRNDTAPLPSLSELSLCPLLINSFRGETEQESMLRAKHEANLIGLHNKKIIVLPNRDSVYTAVELGNGIAIACSYSNISKDVTMIPTAGSDTLVCACRADNRRKLVKEYFTILQSCY